MQLFFTHLPKKKIAYGGKFISLFPQKSPMNRFKELCTSTLAQKLVLTLLNNVFELKILNSTPFERKIRKRFRPKQTMEVNFLPN